MTVHPVSEPSAAALLPAPQDPTRRRGVLLASTASAALLVLQVALTDYGTGGNGAGLLWLFVGWMLLWFVATRKSRVAWWLVIVPSLAGAVLHGAGASEDGRSALVAATFLGQAVALLSRPVREHVTGC